MVNLKLHISWNGRREAQHSTIYGWMDVVKGIPLHFVSCVGMVSRKHTFGACQATTNLCMYSATDASLSMNGRAAIAIGMRQRIKRGILEWEG